MASPDQPPMNLFCTNSAPTPIELALVKEELNALDSELSDLQSRIELVQAKIEARRGIISLMRSIPLEILGYIFTFCPRTFGKITAVTLGLVCRRWREATLISHELWTEVVLNRRISYTSLVEWLTRGGNLPKSMTVRMDADTTCQSQQCLLEAPTLLRLLIEGPQINELRIDTTGPGCLERFFAALESSSATASTSGPRPWDALRSLDVNFLAHNTDIWPWDHSVASKALPALPISITALSLTLPPREYAFEAPINAMDARLDLSPTLLAGLTSLCITCDWSGTQILSALQHCANLEHLELNVNFQDIDPTAYLVFPSCFLPKLRTVALEEHCLIDILKHMTTPVISSLKISSNEESFSSGPLPDDSHLVVVLRDFAKRHAETLERLHLCEMSVTPRELAAILQSFPKLKHLRLETIDTDLNALFDTLQSAPAIPLQHLHHLPRLELLELFNLKRNDSWIIFESISRYLRKKGPHRIQVNVSFQDPPLSYPINEEQNVLDMWYRTDMLYYTRRLLGQRWEESKDRWNGLMTPSEFGAVLRIVPLDSI